MKILHETNKEVVVSFTQNEIDILHYAMMDVHPLDDNRRVENARQFRINVLQVLNDHFAKERGNGRVVIGHDGNGSEVIERVGGNHAEVSSVRAG